MSRPAVLNASKLRSWLPPRKKTAHKGDAGRVYLVAGSRGMAGAAVLCAMGAARSGAGLVRLGIVKSQQNAVVRRAPVEITTQGLDQDRTGHISVKAVGEVRKMINQFRPTVIAAGPGLGTGPGMKRLLPFLLTRTPVSVVLDADALSALANKKSIKKPSGPVVLTPHTGEISRLLGWSSKKVLSDRARAVKEAARRYSAVCLLKGPGTLISDGKRIWENPTGNPAMASGGMGDVLTGIIAALWAQMPDRTLGSGLKAASMGAYIHGLAGDMAVGKYPERTLLASDLARFLPEAFKLIFGRNKR